MYSKFNNSLSKNHLINFFSNISKKKFYSTHNKISFFESNRLLKSSLYNDLKNQISCRIFSNYQYNVNNHIKTISFFRRDRLKKYPFYKDYLSPFYLLKINKIFVKDLKKIKN